METVDTSDKIYIKIDDNIYVIEGSEIFLLKLQILELLDNEINHINKKLNFHNIAYEVGKNKLVNNREGIIVFIPAHVLKDDTKNYSIYSPHILLYFILNYQKD